MKYTPQQYATALHQAIFEANPKDQEKILDNFVGILKQNGDLAMVDEIEKEFYAVDRAGKNVKLAEITTATALGKDQEHKLLKELNEYVGGKVELKKKIDKGLIGGVIVRIADELIDGSVKRTLKELKDQLIK